jgi:hypothetical protein
VDTTAPTPAAVPAVATPETEGERAQRIFSISIMISAVRCTLTYVVLPWIAPLVGIASGVGPAMGVVVGLVAIFFNGLSIRRFWRARHPWRYRVGALNAGIIVLLVVLVSIDLADLLG